MSCQVKTNQNNKIVNVLAENGEHSFLFERINSLPFIGNKEDALKYYMYAIKKIKNRKDVLLDENGEPILAFKPNSTKTEYYNINGVVLEDSFESARKQDFQKKGVQLGFLSSKNAMGEQTLKGGRSAQDSEFAKILDRTNSIQRTMFSNGEVKYATPQENNFIIFDTIQRDVDKTSFAGFIETLQDSGLELNETEESTSEDYTIEDISPTEKSIITIDGKKEVLRLKRYKDGYKVVGKQATQKSAYLNAQKLLNGVEIYSDNLTPNTKRVWEKLVREGKAISVENGFVLKGTKAKEISGTINIGGATLEYGERINFITEEPTGEIELKLVTSENKGRGEAKKVIEEFLQRTDKAGRDTYLTVAPRNSETTDEGLIRLYESFGYVLEPTGFEMTRKARKPQFQIIGEQSAKRISTEETTNEIISKLKENGLAEEVFQLSTQEMLDKLKELGVSDEVAFQITAWHGSPYSFDRFTTDKMGTGEGIQAFGWGLYFTDLESIARNYAEELTNEKLQDLGDFTIVGFEELNDFDYFAKELSYLGENKRGKDALKELERLYKEHQEEVKDLKDSKEKEDIDYVKFLNNQIELIGYIIPKAENRLKNLPKKNLYKVSLQKDKTPNQYTWLEWDKESVTESMLYNIEQSLSKYSDEAINLFREEIYAYENTTGERLYTALSNLFKKETNQYVDANGDLPELMITRGTAENDKDASLILADAGISGIKYPAESLALGATSDTARGFNYVVFDENAITIEEQIQFSKALSEKGVKMLPKGFVFNEKYNPTKLLNILIEKGEIEKIC